MTFTFKCYQNNFMIQNLNIASFGDCFGSVVACMAFALLIELSRGIDLYLRYHPITRNNDNSHQFEPSFQTSIRRQRFLLHIIRSLVHMAQAALSYLLMLMVMNDFAGFFLSAVIALGIGYYLLNGVHPYTRSDHHVYMSNAHSDLINPPDILHEDENSPIVSQTGSSYRGPTSINS